MPFEVCTVNIWLHSYSLTRLDYNCCYLAFSLEPGGNMDWKHVSVVNLVGVCIYYEEQMSWETPKACLSVCSGAPCSRYPPGLRLPAHLSDKIYKIVAAKTSQQNIFFDLQSEKTKLEYIIKSLVCHVEANSYLFLDTQLIMMKLFSLMALVTVMQARLLNSDNALELQAR